MVCFETTNLLHLDALFILIVFIFCSQFFSTILFLTRIMNLFTIASRNNSIFIYHNVFIHLGIWGENVAQNDHVYVHNTIFVHKLQNMAFKWEDNERYSAATYDKYDRCSLILEPCQVVIDRLCSEDFEYVIGSSERVENHDQKEEEKAPVL